MDEKSGDNEKNVCSSGQVNEGTSRNSNGETSNSHSKVVLEDSAVSNADDAVSTKGKVKDSDANMDGFESSKLVVEASGGIVVREPLDEGTSGNMSCSVNEVVLERMIVMNSGEIVSINGENRTIGIKIDELGLTGMKSDPKVRLNQGSDEIVEKFGQPSHHNPNNSTNGAVPDTVILVNPEESPSISRENQPSETKTRELGASKISVDKSKTKVSKGEKQSCVIDVKCGGGGFKDCDGPDGEIVCRICHLNSEGMAENAGTTSNMELIQLGCGCKDELGIAHAYCAEAWFKLKGNRMCEICGETAKNITGVGDNRFMEDWNQRRFITTTTSTSSERGAGCWRGQPFCNFLMACLVIAFVLPWFFRVNMF